EAKTRLIPYVAIGTGLKHSWAHAWVQVAMDAAQATFFLQEFLMKAGIEQAEDRSPLTYSRQAFTSLYGKVLLMFHHIRDGKYDPDLNEVGRIVEVAKAGSASAGQGGGLSNNPGAQVDSSSSGESSDGSGDRESEAAGGEDLLRRVPFRDPVDHSLLKVHRLSGIVHHLKEGVGRPSCGRSRFLLAMSE
ncbi:kptA, partial [Symbiodinium necroappetens]